MSNRIACLYLPSFPLQIQVRLAPHLAGKPFAITGGGAIITCSRAAFAEGVRPQMTVAQARATAPGCRFIPGDPELYHHALVALAESLLPHSLTIDIGRQYEEGSMPAHAAIYLQVPPRRRGQRYGERLLEAARRGGYRARAGIADDRFTAWAAAVSGGRTPHPAGEHAPFAQVATSVPRGGAAAYLAPLSIDLLPLSEEVRHLLATLGVTTLGEFAALPPPTVGRRFSGDGIDVQRLASGLGPTALVGFTPATEIAERLELEHPVSEIEPLSFMLRPLADRVCRRLSGRGLAAARLTLFLVGERRPGRADAPETEIAIEPSRPTTSGNAVVDLARARLDEITLETPVVEIGLLVTETAEPEIEELDLFDYRDASAGPEAVDVAVARLRAAFGEGAATGVELLDRYRPEGSFRRARFAPPRPGRRKGQKRHRSPELESQAALPAVMDGAAGALRLIEPPAPQPRGLDTVTLEGGSHRVVHTRGPARLETEWWERDPVERDYYQVETDDGGRYWVFRHHADGRYYLHGVFD